MIIKSAGFVDSPLAGRGLQPRPEQLGNAKRSQMNTVRHCKRVRSAVVPPTGSGIRAPNGAHSAPYG